MTEDLRTKILHDLKRIGEAIKALISDLDEVPDITKGETDGTDNSNS